MIYKQNAIINFLAVVAIFISCSTTKQPTHVESKTDSATGILRVDTAIPPGFLESLMRSNPQQFDQLLLHKKDLNIQIIYTQINRGKNGMPELTNHYFNVDAGNYFYPASTVKLPVVLLALQRLHELKDKGIDRNTTMLTETAFSGQSAVYNDPTTKDGKPSIAHYIKKILMVSDNDAYNRLYEFLGQEYINTEMKKKGYDDVQIIHRLNIFLKEEENRSTNPVKFYDSSNNLLYEQTGKKSNLKYIPRKDSIGKGFYKARQLVNGQMDFSKKNRISLEDLHTVLISLLFPDKVKASQRFNISEDDRQFVLKYMSQYPTESIYPPYAADTANYWPAYGKFLLFGAEKARLPENIRIFSKEGDAYGHMLDVAYIVDYKNRIEFFLSAIIYCNTDGILNDDKYDYDSIGKPFMKNLGRVIYDYELKRVYKIKPDLSPLLFTYDLVSPKK